MSVAITLAPSDAKTKAVALPMPLPAPVIKVTLPLTDLDKFLNPSIKNISLSYSYRY
jgi:hypothetical protein